MKAVVVAENTPDVPMRPVILWTVVVCVAVAMAPWLSGGQEPIAGLISGGALLLGLLMAWRQPVVRKFSAGPLLWLYLMLVGWGALSLIWSVNRYSTVLWLIQLVAAGLVFRLAHIAAGEAGGREKLIRLYLVSAVAFCGYGLYLYVTGDYDRLTSSLYWANPAAAYLIPALMVGLDRLRQAGRRRWWWAGLTVLVGASFILTDSRAATLVLGILVFVYLLIQRHNKRSWITLLFTVIATVLLSTGFVFLRHNFHPSDTTTPGSRFAEAASGESRSASDRLNYLSSSLDIWFANPVLGTGAGTFGDVHPQYQKTVVSASTSAHNYYVQTLAELGLLGAILLAGVILVLLLGDIRGLWRDAAAIPLLLGLVGLLMHFGLDIDTGYPALYLLAAVWAGLIYRQRPQAPGRLSWRLPAVAAVLLVPLISLYQSDVWAQRARLQQDDNNDYQTAASDFEQAHRGLVYNPDFVNAEGIDYYTLGLGGSGDVARANLALALDRARTAERLDPSDSQHHQLEGRVLESQGKTAAAEAAFKAALKLDPYNHPDYALDLANLQASEGRTDTALATAQSMLQQYPASVVANRAADQTVAPNVADLWALVGNIRLTQGNAAAADTAAKTGLKLSSGNLRCRALAVQVQKFRAAAQPQSK